MCLCVEPNVARAGLDYESSYGKERPNDTILKLQRTTPYYKRNRVHVPPDFHIPDFDEDEKNLDERTNRKYTVYNC